MAKKDNRGRNLKTGEYWDAKNKRYMFRKMVDGERITITDDDLTELRKKENELLYGIDKGMKLNQKSTKMSLNEYFDNWIELYARSGRKSTTCTNYKSYFETYCRNGIGKKAITKINKADIQKIVNGMMEAGLSHSTMANLKSCLNILFECAIDDDIIVKNPAKNIQLPQTAAKKKEALPLDQVNIFMEYVKSNPRYSFSYPAFVVLFNTGVRIGELSAITWEDINFNDSTITINKSLNRYRKKDYGFTIAISSTKSNSSDRVIVMSDITRSVLLRLKMKAPYETKTLPMVDDTGNIRGEINNFIFLNKESNPWTEPTFRSFIKRIVETYNVDAEIKGKPLLTLWSPHQSRHTFTSACYNAGVDVLATSKMVGHKSPQVTMQTYTHLSNESKREQEAIIRSIKIS